MGQKGIYIRGFTVFWVVIWWVRREFISEVLRYSEWWFDGSEWNLAYRGFKDFEKCVYLDVYSILYFCVTYSSYQNNDISEFEKILKMNRRNIMEDPFIREHIEGM